MAVINPLCSTNVDNLISEGVGGAATAYCQIKESLYHDLDLTQYEFLPFIMESTGGLSKAAYDLCKQFKKRRESSNCQSKFDCPYTTNRWPLLSALSIELQRANSRMILERTPVLANLIDSVMVKCELSVSQKKDDANETLRSQKLKPARVHEEIKRWERSQELPGTSCMRGPSIQERRHAQGKPLNKKEKKRRRQSQRERIKAGGHRRQLKPDRGAEPSSFNPKPPWVGKEEIIGRRGGEGVNKEREKEERILTPKLNTSQDPSTFVVKDTSLLVSFDSSGKKVGTRAMDQTATKLNIGDCPYKPNSRIAECAQVGMEVEYAERIHWEPPCGQNLHQK